MCLTASLRWRAQDPKMTDWLWEVRESSEQKRIFQDWRKDKLGFVLKTDRDHRFPRRKKNVSPTWMFSSASWIGSGRVKKVQRVKNVHR